MNYLDKANSLRAFLAQNSLPRLKRKRFGQDGLEEKSYFDTDEFADWLAKEHQKEKEYIEKIKNKKLTLPSPTDTQLTDLETYVNFLRNKANYNDPRYELYKKKGLDILQNTNVLPIENVEFPGMFKTSLDYSSTEVPTYDELNIEKGKYCPECFITWYNNVYPKPKPPQFSIKSITADQYVVDPKTYGLGTNSPEAIDYRYRIETDKGFDILPSKKAFEEWKTKYAKEYQPHYTANTGKAPVLYNQTGAASYNETPTLKYEEAPTLVKKYGGTIYKKKSKLKQTYLNKYK